MCVSFEELVDGLPKDSKFSLEQYFDKDIHNEPDLDNYISGGSRAERKEFELRMRKKEMKDAAQKRKVKTIL